MYQPDIDLSTISIDLPFGIVVILLAEVDAPSLKLRLAVVTPVSEIGAGCTGVSGTDGTSGCTGASGTDGASGCCTCTVISGFKNV